MPLPVVAVLSSARTGLLGQVPVAPDAEEARRWAEEELAKAVYDDEPGLLERLSQWFLDLLEAVSDLGGTTPPGLVPLVLVTLAAVVLAVAFLLGGRVRRRRRRRAEAPSHELFDDTRTSEQLYAGADAAARRGDYATAVLERFRAIIRSLDERVVLEDRPGLTAHEAAGLAAAALPAHRDALWWAGQLFDDVRYGAAAPGADEDDALRALARQVDAARPAVAAGR